ncbi:FAD-dependent oxidoreductase [Streptomyces olivaceus]|uniref:FAD-dependent oxidoreductase n=1 Tax=Streptomyces olivaceus TaxID=47716 RepID=UPI001CCE6E7A|nr:FAD-dependent oxidoreductase [Streptomyces olivaceus]MBZ6226722.1 FAD-dependent oxidoreductase [Streptomyces olivaceus]
MTRNDATPALPASTPPDRCDLLVVGLGPLGAHTLREAALRGLDVVGVEQQAEIGHEEGAAGGHTRIFRLAYKEGPAYVPALRESLDVWRDLATQTANAPHGDAEPLLHPGGVLTVGAPDHPDLRATVEAARGLADLEVVPAGEVARRWPQHLLRPGDVGLYDPAGLVLRPPAAVRAAVAAGRAVGATVLTGTRVTELRQEGTGVRVVVDGGASVLAGGVVVAGGAWTSRLLPSFAAEVELRRAVSHWFRPLEETGEFGPDRFPVGFRRSGGDDDFSYFPAVDARGVKVNLHVRKQVVTAPERHALSIPDALSDRVAASVGRTLRGLETRWHERAAYVESYTPDLRCVLGPAPELPGCWILAGGSGQAFKMAPALGRAAVDGFTGTAVPGAAPVVTRMPGRPPAV